MKRASMLWLMVLALVVVMTTCSAAYNINHKYDAQQYTNSLHAGYADIGARARSVASDSALT